jgi:hypothetical protein
VIHNLNLTIYNLLYLKKELIKLSFDKPNIIQR